MNINIFLQVVVRFYFDILLNGILPDLYFNSTADINAVKFPGCTALRNDIATSMNTFPAHKTAGRKNQNSKKGQQKNSFHTFWFSDNKIVAIIAISKIYLTTKE